MKEENVVSFYQQTMKERVVVTDELLDALAEEYFVRETNFENMNYAQWVEYRVWQLSNKQQVN